MYICMIHIYVQYSSSSQSSSFQSITSTALVSRTYDTYHILHSSSTAVYLSTPPVLRSWWGYIQETFHHRSIFVQQQYRLSHRYCCCMKCVVIYKYMQQYIPMIYTSDIILQLLYSSIRVALLCRNEEKEERTSKACCGQKTKASGSNAPNEWKRLAGMQETAAAAVSCWPSLVVYVWYIRLWGCPLLYSTGKCDRTRAENQVRCCCLHRAGRPCLQFGFVFAVPGSLKHSLHKYCCKLDKTSKP